MNPLFRLRSTLIVLVLLRRGLARAMLVGISSLLACLAHVQGARANGGTPILFAADAADSNQNLYTVDPATGAGTLIGDIGPSITGLAFHPFTGVLYGSTAAITSGPAGSLVTIDTTTAAATLVGSFNLSSVDGVTLADLSFDPATGILYGWRTKSTGDLYTVNLTTGAATKVGESGLTLSGGNGLAFNAAGTLYLAGEGTSGFLRTINKTTGLPISSVQLSGYAAAEQNINSLAFDGASLFGVTAGAHDLIGIDTTTGVITTIGMAASGSFQPDSAVDAIAFTPSVPLPPCTSDEQCAAFCGVPLSCTEPHCLGLDGCACSTAEGGTVCRPAVGPCDLEEKCTGSAEPCPPDAFEPPGTFCGESDDDLCTTAGCRDGICDQDFTVKMCDTVEALPVSNECVEDPACNPDTGACESANKPRATPCTDTDGNPCTIAACDGNGSCDQAFMTDPKCQARCGNEDTEPGEECDDGNTTSCDGCSADCKIERCGDGIVCDSPGGGIVEECDPPGSPCVDGLAAGPASGLVCNDHCQCEALVHRCGDGMVDPGETCDPPGSQLPPVNGSPKDLRTCRSDCTFCGDGIVGGSPGGGLLEICDDGNSNDLDNCSNECQRIQNEPARIKFRPRPLMDEFKMHARLQPRPDYDASANVVTIQVENANGVVFHQELAAGQMTKRGKRYEYRDTRVRKSGDGGIALFRLIKRGRALGSITVKLYDDMSSATLAHMRTTVTAGGVSWAIEGDWRAQPHGWYLSDVRIGD